MTPGDLAALHAAAFTQERPWSTHEFAELLAHPLTHIETAEAGFALWRGIAGEAELLTIAVDPAHQRHGLGTALMRGWMAAASRSCDSAFLEVASDNTSACALYQKHGFEVVATRAGYYKRETARADALVMRAALPFSVLKKASGGIG